MPHPDHLYLLIVASRRITDVRDLPAFPRFLAPIRCTGLRPIVLPSNCETKLYRSILDYASLPRYYLRVERKRVK